MKILKIIVMSLSIVLIGLLSYANLRKLSPTEKLKRVQLASFTLNGDLSSYDKIRLEKSISSTPGISACSVGIKGDVASVIYYPETITLSTIAHLLSNEGKILVKHKDISHSGGCPVHKVNASLHQFMAALDFRKF